MSAPIAFYCERKHGCKWQGFYMCQGLAWGPIPPTTDKWREVHDLECGGRLIPLSEMGDERIQRVMVAAELALGHLVDADSGKKYDPSWIRPQQMSVKEIREACQQAYHALNRVIEEAKQ